MQHTDRRFHGIDGSVQRRDSHILVNAFDYLELKPIADVVPVFREAKALGRSECEGLYCSEPYYIPVRNRIKLVLSISFVLVAMQWRYNYIIMGNLNYFAGILGIFQLRD